MRSKISDAVTVAKARVTINRPGRDGKHFTRCESIVTQILNLQGDRSRSEHSSMDVCEVGAERGLALGLRSIKETCRASIENRKRTKWRTIWSMTNHKSRPKISGRAKFARRSRVDVINSTAVVARDSTPRARRKALAPLLHQRKSRPRSHKTCTPRPQADCSQPLLAAFPLTSRLCITASSNGWSPISSRFRSG
jgi:hypothetical protein